MKLFTAVVVFLLVGANSQTSSADQRKKAADNSGKILTDLYITLRNIVFPKSPLSNGVTFNRFVLLSPGKVLNYWDYYPGPDYEESLLRRNNSAPETLIPPSVMEKWFDIADVMVGADPFTGGVTAKSMARVYEIILSQIKLLGLETKTSDAQTKYNVAKSYLTTPIFDPNNLTMNTTRLSLYDRYQNEYADKRLDMEDKINEARSNRGYLEYELWFQRNYPSLNSKVESSYMKWLTFGEKDLVELYKAYLDSGSSGAQVEEARMALRASGVTSLDRTRTMYPVSFEPGNWYKYLLPKKRGPSRDMMVARKSMLESELSALKSMIAFNQKTEGQASDTLNNLKTKLNSSTEQRENKTSSAATSMRDCMSENAQQGPPGSNRTSSPATQTPPGQSAACNKFKQANNEAVTATFQQAQVQSEYENAAFLLNTKGQFNGFLQARVEGLTRQIESIGADLNASKPYLGGVVDSREFRDLNSVLNETEQNLDDAWTAFEYNSDSSHIKTDQETNSLSVAAGIGVGGPGFGLTASANYAKGTVDLKQALNSANLKVSGELLRVVIKRPWFRPSIFQDPSLSFVQRDESEQKNAYVSPGPLTERELRNAIGGSTSNTYVLPEYVSSFLLARGIQLQFSGVDANSVSHAMQMVAGGSFSASYGMYSASASVGLGKTKQSVTADRTANGLIINIPGAQIIGYFTEVLPLFPTQQK